MTVHGRLARSACAEERDVTVQRHGQIDVVESQQAKALGQTHDMQNSVAR
jgi:hypothetical protein